MHNGRMEPFFNEREFLGSGARGMPEPGGGRKEVDAVLSLERELVEQGDVVCSVSPKGECVYVSEPFCRLFGNKRSQLIGKKSVPLAVPEDVPTVDQRLESLSSMNPVVGVMNRVLNVRNEVRWLQFVYRGIYGPRGRLIETRIVGRDITDRIAVEQALRESNERWKFAIESSGDGVWDWDLSTGRVKFSKRWKEMLGYSEDDIGEGVQDWQSRVHPDDLPAALAALKAHLERRKALYIQEFRMRKKDGRWKWN